jgi:hypothetical protein
MPRGSECIMHRVWQHRCGSEMVCKRDQDVIFMVDLLTKLAELVFEDGTGGWLIPSRRSLLHKNDGNICGFVPGKHLPAGGRRNNDDGLRRCLHI